MADLGTFSSKEELRKQFRTYRADLSSSTYRAKSTLICTRVLGIPAVARATVVHTYWPQISSGEIDTRPLVSALRSQGKSVVLPVVTNYDPDFPDMQHRHYDGPGTLRTNRWGIPEPSDTDRVPAADLDVVIVPALGAGRDGHRVGHGSGYYDAFLNEIGVPRIILAYENCLASSIPTEAHDVPGTHVVTERNVLPASRVD